MTSSLSVSESSIDRRRNAVGSLLASARNALKEVANSFWLYLADILICGVSIAVAMYLRLGFFNDPSRFEPLLLLVPLAVLIGAIVFPAMGLYRRHLRTTSLRDALLVTIATGLMCACLVIAWAVFRDMSEVARSAFVIQFLVATPALIGLRIAARRRELAFGAFGRGRELGHERIPVLLVGTGTSCDLFLRSLRRDRNRSYEPVGIIDDVQGTRGLHFHDVPILGSIREADELIAAISEQPVMPRHLVLTEPVTQFASDGITKLFRWADTKGLTVSKLPGLGELREYGTDVQKPAVQEVNFADVLDRPQHVIERSVLRRMVGGRRVLVTGAGGSIGSELVRQLASLDPAEIVLLDNCEFNLYQIDLDIKEHFPSVAVSAYVSCVRDRSRMFAIFDEHRPELIFNAAALKHVPMVELNPCEGVLTNAIGTRNIADAATRVEALAMVQVSTDKAVNATNVMGASKRIAEFYCQALDRGASETTGKTRFMTVRFGNVLGSSGSLIPLFQRQIARGGPLTVTDERMERFFMTIREAVELTLLASAHGLEDHEGQGGIFVLDMGDPVKIIDIAERMIRLAGLRPGQDIDIEIIGTRPGEKLFEELFDATEESRPSSIPGVNVASPVEVALEDLVTSLHWLEDASRDGDRAAVLRMLEDLVPGYRGAAPVADAPKIPELRVVSDSNPQVA